MPELATVSGGGWKNLLFFEGTDTPGASVRRNKGFTEVHIAPSSKPGKVLAGNAVGRLPGGEYSVEMKSGDIFVLSYLKTKQ